MKMKKPSLPKPLKNLSSSEKDVTIIFFLVIVVFILSTTFNFFDLLLLLIHRYDSWQLDDLIVICIFLVFALVVYSYRRSKEMKQEIKDKTEAEAALLKANKKLNLLFNITRHDINNQLMSINGFLELLHENVTDPALENFFTRITKASSQISTMIRFTKEYEQVGVHAPSWQDCRTLVDTAVKQAPLGQVVVNNDLPAGMEVFADPLVVKVFYNLMENAVRYGGKITTIQFSANESGNDYIVVCEDDGDGVAVDEKEKIFGRGYGKNTGLGLALSREVLVITGITIKETGEPGKGARFEMLVPKGVWRMTGKWEIVP